MSFLRTLTLSIAVAVAPLAQAQDAAAVDRAVERAVAFLMSQQGDGGHFTKNDQGKSEANAFTALAVMGMVSVGHQPTDNTPEGQAVRRGIQFLLQSDRQDASGYYGKADGSRMYGHGIVTLMLAEMLGMGTDAEMDAQIRDKCQKAIDLIVRSQKTPKGNDRDKGGWRYQPDANDADLSVSVWQVMALRAAKNAGLVVPSDTIDAAIAYVKRTYKSDRDQDGRILKKNSSFGYGDGRDPMFSTACEGLLALQVCGLYDAEEIKNTVGWLREKKLKTDERWFYYGIYYYAQGMYQVGGEDAERARADVERILLAEQKEDGSWAGRDEEGKRVYSTSMGLLSLSVRYHFMPIYQR